MVALIILPQSELDPVQDKGKLKVAIKFCPYDSKESVRQGLGKGVLYVSVKEATGLPQMDPNGLTDAMVKMYLLPSRLNITKKKTRVINNDLNPIWNEEFEFRRVSLEDLRSSRVLELTVWDYDRRGCKDFIGCLRLGPNPSSCSSPREGWMDSAGEEVVQWEAMLSNLGEWMEQEHCLRPLIVDLVVQEGPASRGQKRLSALIQEGRIAEDPAEDIPEGQIAKNLFSIQGSIPPLSSIPSASFECIVSEEDDVRYLRLLGYSLKITSSLVCIFFPRTPPVMVTNSAYTVKAV